MKEKIKTYLIAIIIPLAVGGLSALFTRNNMDIYNRINVPSIAPPSILFPIVWTILYILMGISSALIYTSDAPRIEKSNALYTYAISLFVNFFWSIIFFNWETYLLAFAWLSLLAFLIVKTIIKYYKINPVATYLQIPYLLWVLFAGYLNFNIWLLNK